MRDPFKIDTQTCISFSGGRTRPYMLWRVLQANCGLPIPLSASPTRAKKSRPPCASCATVPANQSTLFLPPWVMQKVVKYAFVPRLPFPEEWHLKNRERLQFIFLVAPAWGRGQSVCMFC